MLVPSPWSPPLTTVCLVLTLPSFSCLVSLAPSPFQARSMVALLSLSLLSEGEVGNEGGRLD